MAIEFRSATSGGDDSSTTASPTVDAPAGLQDNDLIVISLTTDTTVGINSAPAGWTMLAEAANTSGNDSSITAMCKIASSEGASWTFTNLWDDAEYYAYGCVAYSGVDTTTPLDVSAVVDTPASTDNPTAGAITPSNNDCMILGLFGADVNADSVGAAGSSPACTERVDHAQGVRGWVYIEEYLQETAAEVTLDMSLTRYGSPETDEFVSIAVALREAAAGGATAPTATLIGAMGGPLVGPF